MGASLRRGKAAVSILVWPRLSKGQDVVKSLAGQISSQWKSFKELRKGVGEIAAVSKGGKGYSLARIGPDEGYPGLHPAWDAIIGSFRPTAGASAEVKGKGSVYSWQVTSPKGDVVVAKAYSTVIMNHGVALLAFGFKSHIETREASFRKMFSSIK